MIDIEVPEFTMAAGGARLDVEHLHGDRWKATVPNNVGITPQLRFRACDFDMARNYAAHLADVFAAAEARYQELRESTTTAVETILEDAERVARRAEEGGA